MTIKVPQGGKILVVDDDDDLAWLLKQRLDRDGFRSDVVSSVVGLRQWLANEPPDAVVVDLNLGSEDRLQVIEVLAMARFSGPMVLISGSDDRVLAAAQRHANNLGLNTIGNLRKPFSPTDLSEVLQRALGAMRPVGVGDVTAERRHALRQAGGEALDALDSANGD